MKNLMAIMNNKRFTSLYLNASTYNLNNVEIQRIKKNFFSICKKFLPKVRKFFQNSKRRRTFLLEFF